MRYSPGSFLPMVVKEDTGEMVVRRTWLPRLVVVVVANGFGVDEDAVDVGGFEFELVFEAGDDVVDVLHLEGVREGAVAGDVEAVADASDDDVVDVEDLWEAPGGVAQMRLDLAVALYADGRLDG